MTKLRMVVAAIVAALAVAAGGLITAPSASAMRMTCAQAMVKAAQLEAIGDALYVFGDYSGARAYYARAQGLIDSAC